MKKNAFALSISMALAAMGFVGGASADVITAATGVNTSAALLAAPNAVNLFPNGDGVGHILVVPYFTSQNNQSSLISIVNTSDTQGKAVKVRYRGASNSDDIFDFTLFLSPNDVWTGNVSKGADGRSVMTTTDKSCTLPANINGAFVTTRLPSYLTADQKADETREGYVEILNMADIPPGRYTAAQTGLLPATGNPLFAAIDHVAGVPSCDTATLNLLNTDPIVHNDDDSRADNAARQGLALPTGGLFSSWVIVNFASGVSYTGGAASIGAYNSLVVDNPTAAANLVFHPQRGVALTTGSAANARTADPLLAGGFLAIDSTGTPTGAAVAAQVTPLLFDFPDLSTPYLVGGTPTTQTVDLTRAFAVASVNNEFVTDPTINATTDWVFASPTRRYSVALDYDSADKTDDLRVFSDLGGTNETYFHSGNSLLNTSRAISQICVDVAEPIYYDREERESVSTDFVISPGIPSNLEFCGEVSVVKFSDAGGTSTLGAVNTIVDLDIGTFVDGWLRIGTPGNTNRIGGGADLFDNGLPILGSAFVSAKAPNVREGVEGTFGLTYPHRFTRTFND